MNLVDRIRRRLSPFHGMMSAADYRAVAKSPAYAGGTTTLFGRPIAYSAGEGFLHSVREIFIDQVYKFTARTQTPHIVDAGANIGLSVLYFKQLYPRATIEAFEPDPAIFALLQRNVGDFSDVTLQQAAAWVDDTELTFYAEGSLAGSTEVDFADQGKATVVRAQRLKTRLQRPIDFLKIDIEGAENSVLFDIEDELANVDCLFFEYHSLPDKPQRLGEMLDLVRRAGFRYTINGTHGAVLPFIDRIESGFDLQLNVSCVRAA